MIERYTLPEMGHIWSLENKFDVWKEIEVLACEAQAELGQCGITADEAAWIRAHADFTVDEIDEVEKITNHDVIAFTTVMANYIDADVPEGEPKPSRWVHYGMTSLRPRGYRAELPGHPGPRHHHRRCEAPGRDLQASCV